MKLATVLLLALLTACTARAAEPIPAAIAAAWQWLVFVDGEDYGAAWASASPLWKDSTSEEKWTAALRALREPLGGIQKREVVRALAATSIPGRPEGSYVIVQFRANFASRSDVMEKLTMARSASGDWQACEYAVP